MQGREICGERRKGASYADTFTQTTYMHAHTVCVILACYNGIPEGFNFHSDGSQEPDSGVQSVCEQIYREGRLLGGMTVFVCVSVHVTVCCLLFLPALGRGWMDGGPPSQLLLPLCYILYKCVSFHLFLSSPQANIVALFYRSPFNIRHSVV